MKGQFEDDVSASLAAGVLSIGAGVREVNKLKPSRCAVGAWEARCKSATALATVNGNEIRNE